MVWPNGLVVRSVQRTTRTRLPAISDLYRQCCRRKTWCIFDPSHRLFTLLPSDTRYRCTSRFLNCWTVYTLHSLKWLNLRTPWSSFSPHILHIPHFICTLKLYSFNSTVFLLLLTKWFWSRSFIAGNYVSLLSVHDDKTWYLYGNLGTALSLTARLWEQLNRWSINYYLLTAPPTPFTDFSPSCPLSGDTGATTTRLSNSWSLSQSDYSTPCVSVLTQYDLVPIHIRYFTKLR